MKASDLMVGDWIYYENSSVQIKGIDSFKGENASFGDEFYPCKDFEPILLTPEVLEKNGFRKSVSPPGIHAKCYEFENKEEKYLLTIANYNRYKRLLLNVDSEDSECFNIKCDYVHELQHALRLCGIKKEIEIRLS